MRWRRALKERKQQGAAELLDYLQQFKLQEGSTNRWEWKGGTGGVFSVSCTYSELLKVGRNMLLRVE